MKVFIIMVVSRIFLLAIYAGLVACSAFLAGMVVTGLIFVWDSRIKGRKDA